MIVGYMVLRVNDDLTIKDVLWGRRILYKTWEAATAAAKEKADGWGEVALAGCSKSRCDRHGETMIYRAAEDNDAIYIVAVYDS